MNRQAGRTMYRWTRLSSQKWEDAWAERLQFIGPERVAMSTWPGSRALKIEVFCDRKTGLQLVKRFGGRTVKIDERLLSGQTATPRPPLSIRGKLRIYSDEQMWRASHFSGGMWIPAGMAFGTGDHATTATCLRLLSDLAAEFPSGWRAMDAGTGSGILAIAAERLGASAVEAFDFDPACVRISKANARANGCRKIQFTLADSRVLGDFHNADVILANLFSELLLASAPGFARKLLPGGWLIFSGVLRTQAGDVVTGLVKAGFEPPRIVSRGKWCAGIAALRRPA